MTARKPGTRNMDPEQFYKDEAASLASGERSLTRKSNILAGCRFILFCGIAASVWYTVRTGGIVPYLLSGATVLALAGWISGLIAPGLFCSLFLIQLLASAIAGRRTNKTMQITDELHMCSTNFQGSKFPA